MKLKNWHVVYNPFRAPECFSSYIVGEREDGKRIRTSPIVGIVSDRSARTSHGRVYEMIGPGICGHHSEPSQEHEKPFEFVKAMLEIQERFGY